MMPKSLKLGDSSLQNKLIYIVKYQVRVIKICKIKHMQRSFRKVENIIDYTKQSYQLKKGLSFITLQKTQNPSHWLELTTNSKLINSYK